jgi:hypothetical protein
MDMRFLFSQSVVYVGGLSFYLGMWSLTLGCVFSKFPPYKVSLFSFFVSPTVLKYDFFIGLHIPVIVKT